MSAVRRIVRVLAAGRPARAVAARVALAFVAAGSVWASACVFLILEPRP